MKYSCTPNTKERKKCPFEVHYVIQSTKQNTNNQRSAQLIQKKRVQPLVSKKNSIVQHRICYYTHQYVQLQILVCLNNIKFVPLYSDKSPCKPSESHQTYA